MKKKTENTENQSFDKHIGEVLDKLVKERKKSGNIKGNKEIAEKIGVELATVQAYLRGDMGLSAYRVKQFIDILQLTDIEILSLFLPESDIKKIMDDAKGGNITTGQKIFIDAITAAMKKNLPDVELANYIKGAYDIFKAIKDKP
jgi:transcriptional regulator with XRE-family HTH domain